MGAPPATLSTPGSSLARRSLALEGLRRGVDPPRTGESYGKSSGEGAPPLALHECAAARAWHLSAPAAVVSRALPRLQLASDYSSPPESNQRRHGGPLNHRSFQAAYMRDLDAKPDMRWRSLYAHFLKHHRELPNLEPTSSIFPCIHDKNRTWIDSLDRPTRCSVFYNYIGFVKELHLIVN
jgi:hypothetical protein